jgi:hypothetical protein
MGSCSSKSDSAHKKAVEPPEFTDWVPGNVPVYLEFKVVLSNIKVKNVPSVHSIFPPNFLNLITISFFSHFLTFSNNHSYKLNLTM